MKQIAVICFFVFLSCGTVSDSPEFVSGAERSFLMEAAGDSLLVSGEGDAASLMFTSAALLLQPGSARRAELAAKASDASVSGSVTAARLLLETPGGITPFRALRTGGFRIDLSPRLLVSAGKEE